MNASEDQGCLYSIFYAPRERLEGVLNRLISPIAAEIQDHPDLDSLFFVRFSEPRWQLRFRILGRPAWVNGLLRDLVERRVSELEAGGDIEGHELTRYDREYDRYGGELGMSLAERLFHLDSLACLEIVRLDHAGSLAKSRREYAMALVDRFLDLARFSTEDRLEFYRFGYAWALEQKTWGQDDLDSLEGRFQKIHGSLESLFFGTQAEDPARFYGGAEAASVATGFLERARPVVESILHEHRAGRIKQDLRYLFWSYAHMMTNRLGVEATPEAILRFFMFRLLEERSRSAA
ncbi:MAG TPA: thiopeptide-type bacteriocin biosynthesis protein [Candidatus Eisenbacteria bacterium]|nr:thiopeptide-type bacteriocin biosynthesis protein [Candidatus Eisenbacteria bacterium]